MPFLGVAVLCECWDQSLFMDDRLLVDLLGISVLDMQDMISPQLRS